MTLPVERDVKQQINKYTNISLSIEGYISDTSTQYSSVSVMFESQFNANVEFGLYGYSPGGGPSGCKTNNTCTRVHEALSGQVNCLSCSFTTGRYSSLDLNDMCFPYRLMAK